MSEMTFGQVFMLGTCTLVAVALLLDGIAPLVDWLRFRLQNRKRI